MKRIIILILMIAIIATSFVLWKVSRKTTILTPSPNVREYRGIRATLKGAKRISKNTVAVVVELKNRRSDIDATPSLRIGRPRWEILSQEVNYSSVNSGATIIKYECKIPASIRNTLVDCDVKLERSYESKKLKIKGVDTRYLPVTRKIDGAETTILWAGPNPHIVPSSWDYMNACNNWHPGCSKCFGVLVRTKFQKGHYYSTTLINVLDEKDRELQMVAYYRTNISSWRKIDAEGSAMDATYDRTGTEKALDKISPSLGEWVTESRAEATKEAKLYSPMRPEKLLYVFSTNVPPKKITLNMWVRQYSKPIGKLRLSFGNVPIH